MTEIIGQIITLIVYSFAKKTFNIYGVQFWSNISIPVASSSIGLSSSKEKQPPTNLMQ